MRLSNSKVNTWRRCPKSYDYKYIRQLRKKGKALPLERGSWLHELLEAYYLGENWLKIHRKKKKEFDKLFAEEKEMLGDLPSEVMRIMTSYRRMYHKQDDHLIVVDAEMDEILKLPNGDEFNFIIDLVIEEDGGLWLWDHKTVGKFMDADFMLLDTQLTRYFWAAREMGYDTPDCPLRGVIFNEVRTKPPTIPKLLQSGALSRAKNIDTDYFTFLQTIRDNDLDPNDYIDELKRAKYNTSSFFRRTRMVKDEGIMRIQMQELEDSAFEMKIAAKRNAYPRTVRKTCVWDCDYKDLCITELMGGDISSLVKANFERSKRRGGV